METSHSSKNFGKNWEKRYQCLNVRAPEVQPAGEAFWQDGGLPGPCILLIPKDLRRAGRWSQSGWLRAGVSSEPYDYPHAK